MIYYDNSKNKVQILFIVKLLMHIYYNYQKIVNIQQDHLLKGQANQAYS